MTLITAGNSNGVYGRCDAKCHDATNPKCHCICRGRYHGLKSNSPELYEAVKKTEREWIDKLERDGAGVQPLLDVRSLGWPRPRPIQVGLFDGA